ncbi:hypothetical protein [Catenuloplanes atrovinosus]|uniref:Uncharacterized protein n=1 Tax=Catenuloplanes atrovinosus TaxID=137266 RepID=A0AAE3YRY5_9ACTN|nr:hypothetical protein [Catenuloplanes atrovinosus]MDR7278122.1 hypothetical protein [Catenuloplanes atrovinosus]
MGDVGWSWTDAWIFVAVVIADRTERDRASAIGLPAAGATLADVLSAADFLHRSLPQRAEVETALQRLSGAGLILIEDDLFQVAPAGEHLWRTRPFSGLSAAVDTLQAQLNRNSTPGAIDAWTLEARDYAIAVREFSSRGR